MLVRTFFMLYRNISILRHAFSFGYWKQRHNRWVVEKK